MPSRHTHFKWSQKCPLDQMSISSFSFEENVQKHNQILYSKKNINDYQPLTVIINPHSVLADDHCLRLLIIEVRLLIKTKFNILINHFIVILLVRIMYGQTYPFRPCGCPMDLCITIHFQDLTIYVQTMNAQEEA